MYVLQHSLCPPHIHLFRAADGLLPERVLPTGPARAHMKGGGGGGGGGGEGEHRYTFVP